MKPIRAIAQILFLLTIMLVTSGATGLCQDDPGGELTPDTGGVRLEGPARIQIRDVQEMFRNQRQAGRSGIPEVIRAEQLINEGRSREALDMILPLWEQDHEDDVLASTVKRAYKGLKDYDGLERVLLRQIELEPENSLLQSELVEAYFLAGKDDRAIVAIEDLMTEAPSDPDRYNLAARAYLNAGRYPEGIDTYMRARRELGDSLIFAEELGRIFEARREYAAAVNEHFRWLAGRPESARQAQNRITNLIKVPEAVGQITAALQNIVRNFPRNEYAHTLYGDLLFESGLVDSAFAEYRRADALSEAEGVHQLKGLNRCLETGQFEAGRSQSEYFLSQYPSHQQRLRVDLIRAKAELGLGHPEQAVAMLKELAAGIPGDADRASILYEIGEVYRRDINAMDSARSYFATVASTTRKGQDCTRSLIRLGDIAVYYNDLDLADSTYRAALATHPTAVDREEVGFRQAEIELFRRNYEGCTARLKQFVQDFPRGMFVNDALQLSLLIREGEGAMSWALDRYSGALLALRRLQSDSALALLDQIVADSVSKIADEALYQVAKIHASEGAYSEAIADYQRLAGLFPDSPLVPRSWLAIGDLYDGVLGDPAEARKAYQVVITEYRDSPEVEEARLRLQRSGLP